MASKASILPLCHTSLLSKDQQPDEGTMHKLRFHEKSRGGCQNCKLRHVKCDQNRPQCRRCLSYGVHCNFVNGIPELQLAALGAIHIIEPTYRTLVVARNDIGPSQEAALLARFSRNVASTISFGKRLSLFQNEIVNLSCSSPSLSHAIVSLTLMYNRHNSVWNRPGMVRHQRIPSLSEHEIGHWYLATSYFNKDLRSALTSSAYHELDMQQQAALCATSALLAVLSFCYVEATTIESAWPLVGGTSPSGPEDLQWIRMSNGKLAAQTLTRGLARDPIYHPLVSIDFKDRINFPSYDMPAFPNEGELFFGREYSLYESEVNAFLQIAHSNCCITIIFSFWSFVGDMTAEFEYDLRHKKPAALLILLYWYAKLNPIPIWWLKARTTLEGQAICVYLATNHGNDSMIERQLRWPTSILLRMM